MTSSLCALALLFVVGCSEPASTDAPATGGTPATETSGTETPKTDDGTATPSEDKPAEGATASDPTAFKGSDGKLVCPLMGSKMDSESDAVGHVDHEGVRYYMCCSSCLEMGQKDPAMVAKKAEQYK